MARARVRLNRRGVGELLRSPQVEADMLRRANAIKATAVGMSPVGEAARDPHPGQYKASWHTSSTRRGGRRRDRATATVYNTAPHARFVEYGTERVHAHHVLLRAAQAGGG
ncbi:HK97 gp10 family phage protein [Streptomyces reniochalinae]|uniref:HK97 gp10 family phage protein n=1 Tax=Streptomyces reniochalinae TaxID=2250578 RepID=A0A367EVY8_9ACTN|nr:HK97 gp10 family phage protein [Streptomyces reniochalinae]RCG21745.1 HK97 gp10 family phage protein [Streptomyces reniochalinae]